MGILMKIKLLFLMLMLFRITPIFATSDYQVDIDRTKQKIHVAACFKGSMPHYLINGDWQRHPDILIAPKTKPYVYLNYWGSIEILKQPPDKCVRYQVTIASESRYRRQFVNRNFSIISTHKWLWRPKTIDSSDPVIITFNVSDKDHVFTPWPPVLHGKNQFSLTSTPPEWDSRIIVGTFTQQVLPLDKKTDFEIAYLNTNPSQRQKLNQVLKVNGNNIVKTFQGFPQQPTKIIVMNVNRGRGPVPFGQILRGGSAVIWLYVNATKKSVDFINDWTITHEMTHLMMPYIASSDNWISEGLASYFQYVSRAQNGQITAVEAWRKLASMYESGKESAGDQTIRETSDRMFTYWGGAAFFMLSDIEIRLQSHGKLNLQRVFARFKACCLSYESSWRPYRFFNQLDKQLDSPVFIPMYRKFSKTKGFPNLHPYFKKLGINFDTTWKKIKAEDLTRLANNIMILD